MVKNTTAFFQRPVVYQTERDERFRIEMTVGCKDTTLDPKVVGAGDRFVQGTRQVQLRHNAVKVLAGGHCGD